MTTVRRVVTVGRPVDRIASYLSDFTTTAEWDPHTESCRRLDAGPLAVGSRFENDQRLAGRRTRLLYRVAEYEPGRRIVLEGGNETVRSRDEMVFAGTGSGGATVTYTVDIRLQGRAKALQVLVPLMMRKLADDGAAGMRRALERL